LKIIFLVLISVLILAVTGGTNPIKVLIQEWEVPTPDSHPEIVKFLVEFFCGPLVRTSSNIPMPLSA